MKSWLRFFAVAGMSGMFLVAPADVGAQQSEDCAECEGSDDTGFDCFLGV